MRSLTEEEEFELHYQWKHGLFSCLGHLNPALAWRKLQQWSQRRRTRRGRLYTGRGNFKYDPMSYAQNFDEGGLHEEEEESASLVFSSRIAGRLRLPPGAMESLPKSP